MALAAIFPALLLLSPGGTGILPVSSDQHQVSQTYNARPFSYQIRTVAQTDTHRLYRITYPSPITTAVEQNNLVPGDYYVPLAAGSDTSPTRQQGPDPIKRPAVICLHILHGNFDLERITCSTLAAHGIPAMMINASDDEVIPPECTRKLARTLGIADRVHWLPGLGHYTAIAALPDVLHAAVEFFAADLPSAARVSPPSPGGGPLRIITRLAGQVAALAGPDPAKGRGHVVDLEADVTLATGKPLRIRVQIARGSAGRFRLEATLPPIGRVALGQGEYPWMLSAKGGVFKGVGPSAGKSDPRQMVKLRVLAGALAVVAAAPHILEPLVTLVDESTPREKTLRIKLKETARATGRLELKPDGGPARLEVAARDFRAEIRFRQWQINTVVPAEMFIEPPGAECREVNRADLERMFSALFNLAMESL